MIVSSAPTLVRTIDVMKLDHGYQLGDDVIDASGEPSILFSLLRQTIQTAFVRALPDTMWIHAGAVADADDAIVLAGESTAGKSTLVTHLVAGGLRYMTDEIVGLHGNALVTGFPRIPMRRPKSARHLSQMELSSLVKETVSLPRECIKQTHASLRAIVFCKYIHNAPAEMRSLSAGDTAMCLFQTLLNFDAQKENVLPTILNVARTVRAYRLTFSDAIHATHVIRSEVLLQTTPA